jgi:hypothetical protein
MTLCLPMCQCRRPLTHAKEAEKLSRPCGSLPSESDKRLNRIYALDVDFKLRFVAVPAVMSASSSPQNCECPIRQP